MKKRSPLIWIFTILAVVLLALALFLFQNAGTWQMGLPPAAPTPSAAPPPSSTPDPTPEPTLCETSCPVPEGTPPMEEGPVEEEDDGLPLDKLFITVPRQRFEDGGLQLIIPKLDVDVAVMDGVDTETLLRGVGLYNYAQLPSEPRSNTSLAGHRNWIRNGKITLDQPFSYLDELGEGDYLYLRDDSYIYQYAWETTEVVEPDDWGPIYKREYSCITLTTCTPIGVSDHRLVVRGALVDTLPISDEYGYPAAKEADHP